MPSVGFFKTRNNRVDSSTNDGSRIFKICKVAGVSNQGIDD